MTHPPFNGLEYDSRIRVANIIEEGRLGGPQVRMVLVASVMDEIDTLVIMPVEKSHRFQNLCYEHNVKYLLLDMKRITRGWGSLFKYALSFPMEVARLTLVLKRHSIDLVHVSGGAWQWKGIVAARLAGIPSVWHLNDTNMPIVIRACFRLLAHLANGFIFASRRTQEYYGKGLQDRPYSVIPSAVDVGYFNPEREYELKGDLTARLRDSIVIGTVANVTPVKGLETLIRAAAKLKVEYPSLRVLIVGSIYGNQKSYYRKLIILAEELEVADAIEWVGAQEDVRAYLARMSVYVCSSIAESSPISVWEAMSMAKPIVSTDVGDVSRYVRDSQSGYIVDVGDYLAMAERIHRLLSEPDRSLEMGRRGRELAKQMFSPKRIAEETKILYKNVLRLSKKVPG